MYFSLCHLNKEFVWAFAGLEVMLIGIDSIVAANRSLVVAVRGAVPNGRHVFRMEVEHLAETAPAVNVWHLEAEFYHEKVGTPSF